MITRLACAFVLVMSVACTGESTLTAPSASSRGGVWTGTVTDAANGVGALRIVLDDRTISSTDSFLTGSWSTTFSDVTKNASGTLSGGASGTTAFLSLAPVPSPTCSPPPALPAAVGTYIANRLTVDSTTMRGDYVLGTCSGSVAGVLEVRR